MQVADGLWGSNYAPWLAALAAALILVSAARAALGSSRPRMAAALRWGETAAILLAIGVYAGNLLHGPLFSVPRVGDVLFGAALALAIAILGTFLAWLTAKTVRAIFRSCRKR